jgi:DNA polymerase III subunit epsilon
VGLPPDYLQLQLPLPQPQPGSERQATLADKLCDLLVRRGRPLETGHVVAQVLRLRTCPEPLQRRLVSEIVESDERLVWRSRDLVGLAPAGWAATPVDEATFCVVDIETTGGAPGRSKITEIAAVRLRGGEVIDRFETLVNPGRPIPAPITRITGITDAMLVGQPRIEEALERFVAFVGSDVMVAHNAPFDFRFLNYERFRIAGRYFTQPWLDTLVIARRLLRRRLDRFDLGTLAEWAGTNVRPSHRALADAEATAEVLVVLLGLLAERGITTLDRAVGFGQGGGARHAHKLALAEDLPQTPGVYIMRDRDGAPLYVGKARNIRRRVRSYFGPQGRHSRLVARALEGVARIDHEETGSELGALLRETALLRELKPPCNSRGVSTTGRRYFKLTIGDEYPRLLVVADVLDDGAAYYGPIRSERLARTALDALHLLYPIRMCHTRCVGGAQGRLVDDVPAQCTGPCSTRHADIYHRAIGEVRALLDAEQGPAMAQLMSRLAESDTDPPTLRDTASREAVEALIGCLGALGRARVAAHAGGVIVEPGVDGRAVTALFVWNGRVSARYEMSADGWNEAQRCLAALGAGGDDTPPLSPGELDAALILHDWLSTRAGHPGVVPLQPGFEPVAALASVLDAVRAMEIFSLPQVATRGFASAA